MVKDLIRAFLDGAIAGILYNFVGGLIVGYMPLLPFGLSSAIILGVLVLVVDYILKNVARL